MQEKLLRVLIPVLVVLFISLTRPESPEPTKSVLSAKPTSVPIVTQATASAVVVKVVDGDTIHVEKDEQKEVIRLIGIDTPELHDPRKPVECFAEEAKERMIALVLGKTVRLEADPTQSNRDIYGRLLRYVFVDDMLVNERMILEGYAHEYTYDIPYKYQKPFKTAEKAAQEQKKGLWNPSVCAQKK